MGGSRTGGIWRTLRVPDGRLGKTGSSLMTWMTLVDPKDYILKVSCHYLYFWLKYSFEEVCPGRVGSVVGSVRWFFMDIKISPGLINCADLASPSLGHNLGYVKSYNPSSALSLLLLYLPIKHLLRILHISDRNKDINLHKPLMILS